MITLILYQTEVKHYLFFKRAFNNIKYKKMIFVRYIFSSIFFLSLIFCTLQLKSNAEPAEFDKECFDKLFPETEKQEKNCKQTRSSFLELIFLNIKYL